MAKASTTTTPAKRASKPIKGTPRPKSSNAKVTPSSIKKKSSGPSASTSKAKRSSSKLNSSSTKKITANMLDRSTVSPIKESSFTAQSDEKDFRTPVKPVSSVKRKQVAGSVKSNRSSSNNNNKSGSKSSTKLASSSSKSSSRPSSRASPRPSSPNKASVTNNQDSLFDSTLANSILGLREYCSVM